MSRLLSIVVILFVVAAGAGIAAFAFLAPPAAITEAQAQEVTEPPAEPAPAAPAETPAVASTLPGGSSSLTEQHGDWTVSCQMVEAGKRCAFSQALVASQTGQRVLSLELAPAADGTTLMGTLLTPFSLRLNAGVNLTIDDKPLIGPIPFLTCIEMGCLVPVDFDTAASAALRAGKSLKFSAIALSSGQPIELALSLSGFTAASNRTEELIR